MKKIIIFLLMALPVLAMASTPEEVIKKTVDKLGSANGVTADFVATTGDGQSVAGKLTMARSKFAMVGQGFGVWYNGSEMWSYAQQTGETSLTEPTADELMESNPFDILNNYKDAYTVKSVSCSKGSHVIQFTAKNSSAAVKTAVVAIDTNTSLPTSIEATFPNSATLRVSISNAKVCAAPPVASVFCYPASKYPGVEVVDLR